MEEQDGGLLSQEDSKGSRGQCVPTTVEFSGQLSAADADSGGFSKRNPTLAGQETILGMTGLTETF